jgi:hypothetical protein
MGQYYNVVFLADKKHKNEIIRLWLSSYNYMQGSKLTEHAFIGNPFVVAAEWMLCPKGAMYMSRIVWAGDYADDEENINKNLHNLCEEDNENIIIVRNRDTSMYKYIVNHTKRLYVNKMRQNNNSDIHPLPLLVCEGNGRGGGDYYGNNMNLCGTWARDCISMEMQPPEDFTELVCEFYE